VVGGRPGIIAEDRGHYIGVNFDDEKPGIVHNAHPTDEVVYGELGRVRPISRAQKRYNEYLEVADCYESFRAFLRIRHGAVREPVSKFAAPF
jgi:hypothetical protein